MMISSTLIKAALNISAVFIILGALLGFIRLVKGPTLANRVVALDYLTLLSVSVIALIALYFDYPAYLDIAIVLALLSFLAVIAFTRFIEYRFQHGNLKEDLDD